MFWQYFTAFGIMLGYMCGAIFRGILDGTNNAQCVQPVVPPQNPTPEQQQKLLSTRCVSTILFTACSALTSAVSDVRDDGADLMVHDRA